MVRAMRRCLFPPQAKFKAGEQLVQKLLCSGASISDSAEEDSLGYVRSRSGSTIPHSL